MSLEYSIAKRYLFTRRKSFISIISISAIVGVAIGVAALIIVMAVMNGFTTTLRGKILSASAHGIITPIGKRSQPIDEVLLDAVHNNPLVKGVTPFVYTEVILSSPQGVKGVIVRGIKPESAINVISILKTLEVGDVFYLAESAKETKKDAGIVIGAELAAGLGLQIGSKVNLLSSSGKRSSIGFMPKLMPFEVVGIFATGMFEYDMTLCFVNIADLRSLLGIRTNAVSGYEFSLRDLYDAPIVAKTLREDLGAQYRVRTWQDMNVNLFAALELEKTAMFIFLTLIVLVGAFSIVTTLIMLVMEKRKDIAILMSLGATPKMIRNIFLWQGSLIGIIGIVLGFSLGIGLSLLLRKYQFIQLPVGVYPFTNIPVLFSINDILLTLICTLIVCFLATLYPALKASKINPSEALRYE